MVGESSASGPVVFKPLAAGREAVMLGLVQVGEIMPLQDQRKHKASYRIMLPDCAAVAWRPVLDIEAARRGVLHHINDWLNAADLRPNLEPPEQSSATLRHHYRPNKRWPWFCAACGYPEHDRLQHEPTAEPSGERSPSHHAIPDA